jgi:hypothetical protein
MNNPLVPSPERANVWWECSKSGCDYLELATTQPDPHVDHPTYPMQRLG